MARNFAHVLFERYADDIICHCKSAEEARVLWSAIADRLAACKLVLHPEKTKKFDQTIEATPRRSQRHPKGR